MPLPVYRPKLKGLLAYRAWKMEIKGCLSPHVISHMDSWSSEVAFADQCPTAYNSNGLYATKLELWRDNGYADFVCGLVDLYGTVLEHSDGILRAECAKIKCIILTITTDNQQFLLLTGVYEAFHISYPNIPIFIFTPYQKQLYIWREVLINCKMVRED